MTANLDRLLSEVDAVLLDFDGPICSIFAGLPAPQVATELINVLERHAVDILPDFVNEPDPLEVLRRISGGDRHIIQTVEDALCAAEKRAVDSADPTPYGREVIVAARQAGMPVAVVSNNSAGAIETYLKTHRLAEYVSPVVGRTYAEPEKMKPDPTPIQQAVRTVGIPPNRCVLVGDSLTDIHGARAANVRVIGYANRPTKIKRFQAAGADAVVTSMGEIARELIKRSDA